MASLFTGTVEEYASLAAFPLVGAADTIYIALDTNILYRWNGTAYVELSPNIVSSLVFNDANGFDGTINLVGSVATLTITTALTLGSLPFIGASGALSQDNTNLFYDDTNNRLGIGTNAPTTPLDVFGSGIISRINGTSTNNGFLGFASAGTNKWSVGNVQSDHRFRIFSEANTSELVSLLQTGEFGIGIANPTTKLHLDGGASALIANLDANVSVAKSISFRSDNSNRINLEVSGTESGSNAGANFFIRRYSDAGALIDTPLTITRSTGLITLATALAGLSASFSSTATASAFIPSGASVPTNGMYLSAANTLGLATNSTNRISITPDGYIWINGAIAGFSGSAAGLQVNGGGMRNVGQLILHNAADVNLTVPISCSAASTLSITGALNISAALAGTSATFSGLVDVSKSGQAIRILASSTDATYQQIQNTSGNMIVGNESSVGASVFTGTSAYAGIIGTASIRDFFIGTNSVQRLKIDGTSGAATFSSGISVGGATPSTGGIQFPATQVAIANANNLDDYEEGDWSIGLNFGGASVGMTSSSTAGKYTKIGRQVTVTGALILTNKGTSVGDAQITGLPFTIGSGNGFYQAASFRNGNITFADQFVGYGAIGNTTIDLNEMTNGGVLTTIDNTNFANNSTMLFSLTYFV
jgi:hypothetical protein